MKVSFSSRSTPTTRFLQNSSTRFFSVISFCFVLILLQQSLKKVDSFALQATGAMSISYVMKRCAISGVLWGTGDLLSQLVTRHRSVVDRWKAGEKIDTRHHPKMSANWINWDQSKQISAFAFFIFGPLATKWYLTLYRIFPQTTSRALFGRVLYDQLLWSPIILSIFFSTTALMTFGITERGVEECRYRIKEVVPNTLMVNWAVWVPIQALNFYFVPRDRWIYVINAVAIPWNGYLAFRSSSLAS